MNQHQISINNAIYKIQLIEFEGNGLLKNVKFVGIHKKL